MKSPIKLFLDNKEVATIDNFSYETPWASGKIQFHENELFIKLVNVTSMLTFDLEMDELNLPDEEEEKQWESKLSELNLTWADLDLEKDERWAVQARDSDKQNIYALRFYDNGIVEWRI
jgi:hypothetical protein